MRWARDGLGWLAWGAVTFGLLNAGLPHARYRAVEQDLDRARLPAPITAVRAFYTNDGDIRRYYAYVQAALGRPYQSYFVRTAVAWRRAFAAGEPYRPDESATIVPPHPLTPYLDFLVEYPPGFFLAAVPPALVVGSADGYARAFTLAMALALTAALLLMSGMLRRLGAPPAALAGWGALAVLCLGVVATHRYDAAVALAIAGAAAALVAQRPIALGAALAAGVALKGVPLFLVPLAALSLVRRGRRRALVLATAAGLVTGAALLVPALLAGRQSLIAMARYHLDRPLQVESTWGALLGLLHAVAPSQATVEKTFGSTNVVGPLSGRLLRVASAALAMALAAAYLATWRRLRDGTDRARAVVVVRAMAAVLALYIGLAKVSSPQYLVWVLPLGLAVSMTRMTTMATERVQPSSERWLLGILLAILLISQLIYPLTYGALEQLRPWACLLVVLRNLALLVWAGLLLRRPVGEARPFG